MIVVDASVIVEMLLRSDVGEVAYDAAYLALAERLDAPLSTLDTGLASVAGIKPG